MTVEEELRDLTLECDYVTPVDCPGLKQDFVWVEFDYYYISGKLEGRAESVLSALKAMRLGE